MGTLDNVSRQGRERLNPSIKDPNWLVLRRRRSIFQKWIAGLEGGEFDILDVGGRVQPYRALFEGRIRSYTALDPRATPLVDVVGSAEQIPFADAQFDVVICTQVLEYVPRPEMAMSEILRVLKSGGHLLLSVPSVFPRDSEQDSWRFLPGSLKFLLRPFSEFEIACEGSSVLGFLRTIIVCLVTFARPVVLRPVLRVTVVPILNIVGASLELLLSNSNDQFTANFSAHARK